MKKIITPALINELTLFRRYLHAHPESSGNEHKTAEKVQIALHKLKGWKISKGIGGTGIIAIYKCPLPGPATLFRAELDALPLNESNTFNHRSKKPHAAHLCGHDGHMAILLGLARLISITPPEKGSIILLFQPAEETGTGALSCLQNSIFSKVNPDLVFALHNLPGITKNQVIIKDGIFSASVKSLVINIKGKASHAAEPEKGINPVFVIEELINLSRSPETVDAKKTDFGLITPTYLHCGQNAHGSSPVDGTMHFTFRTWSEAEMDYLTTKFLNEVETIAVKYGAEIAYDWVENFPSVLNNHFAIQIIKKAAKSNALKIKTSPLPFRWGEDFGFFTQKFKGAMFGIGAGKTIPPLHSSHYDFPDEIIEPAAELLYSIAISATHH
jgi:amidohydrolase